jgi:hypothetical protein
MTESLALGRPDDRPLARRRLVVAIVIFVAAFCLSAWTFAKIQGFHFASSTVTGALAATIAAQGVDSGVEQYRSLRAAGFPGLSESESDTNTLGYQYLGKGDTAAAIAVLELNVESHPTSANTYDSLAEAYADAGKKSLAIEYYRKAVAHDPDMKSAGIALAALTGTPRKPYAPMILLHAGTGVIGIVFGGLALLFRKGLRRHRWTGTLSALGMLGVAGFGTYLGYMKSQPSNLLAGAITVYLVATGWSAAKRKDGTTYLFDWVGLALAAGLVGGLALNAFVGLRAGQAFAGIFVVFGAVALLAAVADMRMLVGGGAYGAQRIARHLWRICVALLIVAFSFFQGQSQVFPEFFRKSGLLDVPAALIIAALLFWIWRVFFTNAYKRSQGARIPPASATTS